MAKCIGKTLNIGFGFLWQINLLRYKIKKNDIVLIAGNPRYLSSIIFILKVKLLGGKILWWSHYRSSTSKKWSMYLRLKLMKISDGIVFYTQDEVNEYLSTIKQKETDLSLGYQWNDIKPIKKFRKEYNANLRKFEILFLGRISQKSNFNKLLEALSHPSLSKITLNVIGNDHEYSLNRHQSILKMDPELIGMAN